MRVGENSDESLERAENEDVFVAFGKRVALDESENRKAMTRTQEQSQDHRTRSRRGPRSQLLVRAVGASWCRESSRVDQSAPTPRSRSRVAEAKALQVPAPSVHSVSIYRMARSS